MNSKVIHQGWLDYTCDSHSKSWVKFAGKKTWKMKFFVLFHEPEDTDRIMLSYYDKETDLTPKKVLNLFPRYKIAKHLNFKSREHVLEVNTVDDAWYFAAKPKVIDLWALQIQMQTKLSRAITGRIFQVSGAVNKQMQKIGAAQQRCLLHLTKWGVTLALQDSRSILAMWPLSTIRNYECTGQCQFSIEAGRRAPMGEGLFVFYTNVAQDEEIFNVLDMFITAALNEKALISSDKSSAAPTDEEILQTYDQLHHAATVATPIVEMDSTGYSHMMPPPRPHTPSAIDMHKPPDYNHLFNDNVTLKKAEGSLSSNDSAGTPRGMSFVSGSYDKLERDSRLDIQNSNYDHIDQRKNMPALLCEQSYDRMSHASQRWISHSIPDGTSHHSAVGFPLRDEPSVPYLDDNEVQFRGRSKLSETPEETYEFRNTIYSSGRRSIENGLHNSISEKSSSYDVLDATDERHNSTSSCSLLPSSTNRRLSPSNTKHKGTPTFNNKSMKDIADHFLYQMPPSMNLAADNQKTNTDKDSVDNNEFYENNESMRNNKEKIDEK